MALTSQTRAVLSLACNNPDNGLFVGWFDSAEFHFGDLQASLNGPNVKISTRDKRLRVGRITVPFYGEQTWYGNWCWDAWGLRLGDLARVLNYLKSRGWSCEEGEPRFFAAWKTGEPITVEQLIEWEGGDGGE